jgi:hypothetical protein
MTAAPRRFLLLIGGNLVVAFPLILSHHGGTGERRWSNLHERQETPEVTGC